jgi:hypothetical protein
MCEYELRYCFCGPLMLIIKFGEYFEDLSGRSSGGLTHGARARVRVSRQGPSLSLAVLVGL